MKFTSTIDEGLRCPSCGQRAMSQLDKLWLGPAVTRRCRSCAARLSVPWSTASLLWPLGIGLAIVLGRLVLATPWLGPDRVLLRSDDPALDLACEIVATLLLIGTIVRMFKVWPYVPLQDRDHR